MNDHEVNKTNNNNNNNNIQLDDDDDVSFIVNDILELDSQAELIKPCRDWVLYHTTNDTPPRFIPSFDDEMVIVGTTTSVAPDTAYESDGQQHRWI